MTSGTARLAAGGLLLLGLCAFAGKGCNSSGSKTAATAPAKVTFQDVTREAGITFKHDNGSFGREAFPGDHGSGAAFLDADGDGWLDLYLINCRTLPEATAPRTALSRFYHNLGNGKFEDWTEKSGLAEVGFGMGAAVGDINGDGFPDLFVTVLGQDRMFLNNGDGTFRDITASAGFAPESAFGSSAVFLDYNRDGKQDLYVCNYVTLPDPIGSKVCRNPDLGLQDRDVALFEGAPDRLYRNNGDNTFTDVSKPAGISGLAYRGLAVLGADYDQDGWVDIFVANDENPMILWRNKGDGTFEDKAGEAGISVDGRGKMVAGMGLAIGDLNRDGMPEMMETSFQGEPNVLFQMEGPGWFVDRAQRWDLAQPSKNRLKFGVGFLDYDLDGWLDVMVANGHVIDDVQQFQPTISYAQEAQLFRNLGTGRMSDNSADLGAYAKLKRVGRGLILGDYDNDGDLDALFTNNNQEPALLRNQAREMAPNQHWLTLKCVGTKTARDGYGAMVEVEAGGAVQRAECRAGSGYLGSNDPRVNFGLGAADRVTRITVIWPGGAREEFGEGAANQQMVLQQGAGRAQPVGVRN